MSNTPELRSHLERAISSWQAAKLLRSAELPNDATSRAYYAVFHAVSALFGNDKLWSRESHGRE